MNRRPLLAGAPVAAALATTLAEGAPTGGRKRVLIPRREPDRIEGLKAAVPEAERVVAEHSLEQVGGLDAAFLSVVGPLAASPAG
jgi:hypothetical protein